MNPATRRRLLWIVAIAGTAGAVAWVSVDDEEGIVTATRRAGAQGGKAAGAAKGVGTNGVPALLDLDRLEARKAGDMKADLFASRSWYVAPPAPPPPKPKAPPLPFTYAGRLIDDGRTTVFLSRQGRNQLVNPGDLIENTWRVEAIGTTTMTLIYLPLNESQTLALGAAP
jgi:hypothetical protein